MEPLQYQIQIDHARDQEQELNRHEVAKINSDFKIYLDNYKKLIEFNDRNDIEGVVSFIVLLITLL